MEHAVPQTQSPFATEPIGRLIVKFAVPSVIALLVNSLYNIVDQIFIGWGVGYLGNGATNIVFPITIIALALSMMIGNGGAAYLSLKMGEGEVETAKKGVGNAVTLVTIVSILLAVIFLVWIDPILTLFGATDVLRPFALEYGFIIGAGLPFMMISAAINSMIRADGSPKYAMLSMVIGAIINVILDPVFIFVFQMGVKGAAIATIIGQVASFVVSVLYMPHFKSVQLNKSSFAPCAKVSVNIVIFGLSSFITQFAITIVMALTNNLLAKYGAQSVYGAEIPLTATGIVMKVNQIMIAILLGIATGTQPIIGYNYGAKSYHRVKKALEISLIASEIVSVAAFLIFQFAPMSVVSLFGPDERGIAVWLRRGSVQRVCRQGISHLFDALSVDRIPDHRGGLSAGGGQTGQIRHLVPCASDHLFCAHSADSSNLPGRRRGSVDRTGCGRSGIFALACLFAV